MIIVVCIVVMLEFMFCSVIYFSSLTVCLCIVSLFS